MRWGNIVKTGVNPITNEEVTTYRKGLQVDYNLPRGQEYAQYIAALLEE